jgi:hypothetical protein
VRLAEQMVPVTIERSDQKTPALPLWLAKEMVPVKFERALHARSNTKPKINLKGAPGFFPGLWALRSSEAQVFLFFLLTKQLM